jgi:diguanylate cyclase (GGDEF)-like protein
LDESAPGFLPGSALTDLIPEDALAEALSCAHQALDGHNAHFDYRDPAGGRTWSVEVAPWSADEQGPCAIAWLARDTSAVKAAERQLARQALHDPLTGLANRQLFMDRLQRAITHLYRRSSPLAVMFIDLDRLKTINDTLGHAAGDEVLCRVAQRLRRALRPTDTVARFGGDEFVVLCEDAGGEGAVERLTRRLGAVLARPLAIEGQEFVVSASIGVKTVEDPQADPAEIVRDADAAMYAAKHHGRATFEVYDDSMRLSSVQKVAIETGLRRALVRDELTVLYQPQVRLGDMAIVSAEALVRWRDPARGLVDPHEFLGIAEEMGLMRPIGNWVLERIVRDIRQLPPSVGLAMNLAADEVADPDLVTRMTEVVEREGIDPARLCFEVAESALFIEAERAVGALSGLHEYGFRVAIDDFGVGFSSLHNLRLLPPVDILKLDRAFVSGLGTHDTDAAIVASVILLTNSLGMDALGEGVETEAQLELLRMMGCDYAQGFLFGRPQPIDQLVRAWV